MSPGLTTIGAVAYLLIAVAALRTQNLRRRAWLAVVNLAVAVVILLAALANIADEWGTVIVWVFAGVPISALSVRAYRREANLADHSKGVPE